MINTTLYTNQDFLSWGPCADWNEEKLNTELGENWQGTMIDILNHETLPSNAKLWVLIMSKEISDEMLNEFSDQCIQDSFLEGKNFPTFLPHQWKHYIKVELSEVQEKAMGNSLRLILFNRQNRSYNDETLRVEEANKQLNILRSLLEVNS